MNQHRLGERGVQAVVLLHGMSEACLKKAFVPRNAFVVGNPRGLKPRCCAVWMSGLKPPVEMTVWESGVLVQS